MRKVLAQVLVITLLSTFITGIASADLLSPEEQAIYYMYVNDIQVGTIEYASKGLALYDRIIKELYESFEEDVTIEDDIYFIEELVHTQWFSLDSHLAEAIKDAINIQMEAYSISVNGKTICYVKTEKDVNEVLEAVKKPYIDMIIEKENTDIENVGFIENIKSELQLVSYTQIVDKEQAAEIIAFGTDSIEEYEVKQGDNLWDIAKANDISLDDIKTANPDVEGETIHPGQILTITAIRSFVNIQTKEREKITRSIPYDTETKEDSSMYKGETKVIQEGEEGEKSVELLIYRINGEVIESEEVNDTIIKEPINKIVAKGTKNRQARNSSRSTTTRPSDLSPISKNGVEMTPWFGDAERKFARGSTAKVTHVDTGLTFYVKRRGGTNHADSEPLTKQDTQTIKKIYGGSFSWNREAIIVESGGKKMVASMNGMPHGGSSISGNGFNGHFCIHFYKSKGHSSGRVDSQHQAMVRKAAGQ
jgi:LysM repeat protein